MKALLLLGCLCCTACASSKGAAGVLDAPPRHTFHYPSQAFADPVTAQARFYSNHKKLFGEDLIDEYGLVPIALRIGLEREGSMGEARMFPEHMKLRLYLQDGSVLSAVDAAAITEGDEVVRAKIMDETLKPGLLLPFERAPEGFVFFQLDNPKTLTWTDPLIGQSTARPLHRTIDLSKSLCAFEVTIGLDQVPVNVGLDLDKRSERR